MSFQVVRMRKALNSKRATGNNGTIMKLCKMVIVILICIGLSILHGCSYWFFEPYGYVASDDEPVHTDGRQVVIPENAPSISQGYSPEKVRDNFSEQRVGDHFGIDIIGKNGAPVIAPASGVVVSSFFEPFYGNHIVIDHGKDKTGQYMRSRYFHLQKRLVKVGDKLRRGEQLGTLGRTGLASGGLPHLHFEIHVSPVGDDSSYRPVNPHRFWVAGPGIITCFDNAKIYSNTVFQTTYPVPCRDSEWQIE